MGEREDMVAIRRGTLALVVLEHERCECRLQ